MFLVVETMKQRIVHDSKAFPDVEGVSKSPVFVWPRAGLAGWKPGSRPYKHRTLANRGNGDTNGGVRNKARTE